MQITLRADYIHIFAASLDRIPIGVKGGNLALMHQLNQCQKLIDTSLEAAKEFIDEYTQYHKERREFIAETLKSEEFLAFVDKPVEVAQHRLDQLVDEKFDERLAVLNENGKKLITFEVTESQKNFIKMNWENFVFAHLAALASRQATIAIGEAFEVSFEEPAPQVPDAAPAA